jgi:hypothetical protein
MLRGFTRSAFARFLSSSPFASCAIVSSKRGVMMMLVQVIPQHKVTMRKCTLVQQTDFCVSQRGTQLVSLN